MANVTETKNVLPNENLKAPTDLVIFQKTNPSKTLLTNKHNKMDSDDRTLSPQDYQSDVDHLNFDGRPDDQN